MRRQSVLVMVTSVMPMANIASADMFVVTIGDDDGFNSGVPAGTLQAISGGSYYSVGILGTPEVVPVPGAALLGILGMSTAGWCLRRRSA